MLKQFSKIKDAMYRSIGTDSTSVDDATEQDVELRINEAQDVIVFDRLWEWRKRSYYYTLRQPYTTGTISVTKGSKIVTGSGTSFVQFHKTGYIQVNDIMYKIDSVDSATQLTLMTLYSHTTESGVSAKVCFPDFYLHPDITAIINVLYEGKEIDIKSKDRLLTSQAADGAPVECSFLEMSKSAFYTTGTVAVTKDSAVITGTSTEWEATMEDMPFRVDEFGEAYWIKSIDSATQITLDKPYRGSTGSGKSYAIAPAGSAIFTVRGCPDDYYFLEIEAVIRGSILVDGNDYSLIPDHTPLIHAARWLVLQDMEDKNPVRIQQARSDFERTLKQLASTYKVITGVKWKSEGERAVRRNGGVTNFNPLES